MKNKRFIILVIIVFCLKASPTLAKTIVAEVISEMNTQNPPKEFCAKLQKDSEWFDETPLEEGCIIKGEIIEIIPPKIGKRNAYFVFIPKSFTLPLENHKILNFDNPQKITIRHHKPMSKGQIAGKVATTAAGVIVDGLGYGIDFVQGAVKAPEGEDRIKSGIINVYEGSPLSYSRKGYHTIFYQGDLIRFSIEKNI